MNNTFVNAINNQETRTTNAMRANASTGVNCVDLFFKVGASRGKDITALFYAAYSENEEIAARIMQWARDVRGGAGERELFRQVLRRLEATDPQMTIKLMKNIPEIGRWDDLLIFTSPLCKYAAFTQIERALRDENGLCAKWMPRKGIVAKELRSFLDWSPKRYRKTLVELTNVVETPMCANNWGEIDYEKVPSLASARYKRAFEKHSVHTGAFAAYVKAAVAGEAKINAAAVYPHDVLKTLIPRSYWEKSQVSAVEIDHIRAQWAALPNYIGDASVFPMIDVSGSMSSHSITDNLNCLQIAVSLGLYIADKNTGAFKDAYLTFSTVPKIEVARGDIVSKVNQVVKSNWDMSTNLIGAFEALLAMARSNRVHPKDMPETLLILSDMQFDRCVRFDDSALESIARQYTNAGYTVPNVAFWNLHAHDNTPAKFNTKGVALISGFSPAIMKSVLSGNLEQFSPASIMLDAIMIDRYRIN